MFLARAAARHVLITAPSYSTSFDNEAGRSLRQKGLGPTFGCKVQEEERSVVGVGCGVWGNNYSLMWETRWCDAAARLSQLLPFVLLPDSLLSNSTDGGRNVQLRRRLPRAFVRWCMCEHAPSISLHLFVCLSFILFPPWHQNSGRKDGLCECSRSTWTQTKWVRKVQLVCCAVGLQAWVCVCVYKNVWLVSDINGVQMFSFIVKYKDIIQKGSGRGVDGLAKGNSTDQYKRLALQPKIIDSLPIRVFPNH